MEHLVEKAKKIRLLILDVDGVLTDGKLYYGPDGIELKAFNIYDGLGIKLLQKTGVRVAIISAKKSEGLIRRIKEMNIEYSFLGQEEKLPAYEELKQTLKLTDDEIAYIGDDLPDLPLLRRAGLAISVPKAPDIILEHIDFITKAKGGKGAAREACEYIMKAQGTYQTVIQSYLTK